VGLRFLLRHTFVRDGKILLWERVGVIFGWLLLATIILLETDRWIVGVDGEHAGISDKGVDGDGFIGVDVGVVFNDVGRT
jgi:hypothetical protein